MTVRIIQVIDPRTGIVVEESYRSNSRLHRPAAEGPAYIYRDDVTGAVVSVRYYWRGRLHRENGPASLEYNFYGVLTSEMHYRHGLIHRDPKIGPAWIERNILGTTVTAEYYYINDRMYRDPSDGPYEITRSSAGDVQCEWWDPGEPPPVRPRARRPVLRATEPSL